MSPAEFINQHSFVLTAAVTLLLMAVWLFRDGVKPADLVAMGALLVGLTLAYWQFNPGASSETDPEAVLARIGAGTPVLIELQSPY